MKVELGKYYIDGRGEEIGPMIKSVMGGDTPWFSFNHGLYRDNGVFVFGNIDSKFNLASGVIHDC